MENNICVIDDDSISTYITSNLINRVSPDSEINCFENGISAIDYLCKRYEVDKTVPDFIFLDLYMPIMDGWSFLEGLDLLDFDPSFTSKIFIVTTSLKPDDYHKGNHHPRISGYFLKPLNSDQIQKIMN